MEPHYRFITDEDAFGTTHKFQGPHLSQWTAEVHLLQPSNAWVTEQWTPDSAKRDAERIVWMLEAAYEAGRASMAHDLRKLIGAEGTR